MTFQVQRIGDHYGVLFTEEQMRSAGFREGTQVNVLLHGQVTLDSGATGATAEIEYVSLEEGTAAYRATEPRWADVYRELAK